MLTLLSAVSVLVAVLPVPTAAGAGTERSFRVEAGVTGFRPSVIAVRPGDRVTIELVSTDVVHGLYVDGYDLQVSADPGQPRRLSFTASRGGSFRLRCSVTCGPLHPFVSGKLVVGPDWLFWKALAISFVAIAAGGIVVRR